MREVPLSISLSFLLRATKVNGSTVMEEHLYLAAVMITTLMGINVLFDPQGVNNQFYFIVYEMESKGLKKFWMDGHTSHFLIPSHIHLYSSL